MIHSDSIYSYKGFEQGETDGKGGSNLLDIFSINSNDNIIGIDIF